MWKQINGFGMWQRSTLATAALVGAMVAVIGGTAVVHADGPACEGRWTAMPSPFADPNDLGFVTVVHDAGEGVRLFHALESTSSSGAITTVFQRWDGSAWNKPDDGLKFPGYLVDAVSVDFGDGPTLYLGGLHVLPSSEPGDRPLWKWQSGRTVPVGPGQWSDLSLVNALAAFDDGNGSALYAGGSFEKAGGVEASSVAKWNGSQWSALGGGFEISDGSGANIWTFQVYDDGRSERLVAGGEFDTASGKPINNLAMWDPDAGNGGEWFDIGGGVNGIVYDLAVINGELYVAGGFSEVGDLAADGFAKWDGNEWAALPGPDFGLIYTLEVVDDNLGAQPGLYVGGEFIEFGDVVVNHIARFDPVTGEISPLDVGVGGGPFPFVDRIVSHDFGDGARAYVTGYFWETGDESASFIAEWTPPDCDIPGDINGDGVVDVLDLLILISEWGPCDAPDDCTADITGVDNEPDGVVDVFDLLKLIGNWG